MLPRTKESRIACLAIVGIAIHLLLAWPLKIQTWPAQIPLWVTLAAGGTPLLIDLIKKVLQRDFGADLLAGLSIIVSILLQEYLAGALVVLMLSGGETIESYAVRRASSVLKALANRMPQVGHVVLPDAGSAPEWVDRPLEEIQIGDLVVVLPFETCPVDGTVVEGHGSMDESFLTGEPYRMSKAPGASVLSGAVNSEVALTIRADLQAQDSRYARIMQVMRDSEQRRPRMRRLADQLGAWYTPLAIVIALIAWLASGEAIRFLAVLVVATPCPLLIAIPVAIIGSISLAARRSIIVRDPAVLEVVDRCQTMIFDKTGTLTYGQPKMTACHCFGDATVEQVLRLTASVEKYSKHPLASAVIDAAEERNLILAPARSLSEQPGKGLLGEVDGQTIRITHRRYLLEQQPELDTQLPERQGGLECIVLINESLAALLTFRDAPRPDGRSFIDHLPGKHGIQKTMLVSGDRQSEVEYLAKEVGIDEIHAEKSPEDKVELVRRETATAPTVFVGDGINDAPALLEATVGIGFGQHSDVTTEAADVVIMESSIAKVDEFLHISRRLRTIALQSAVGGMAISALCMLVAAFGYLPPVAGAVTQELIDVVVVMNALRVGIMPKRLRDYAEPTSDGDSSSS